MFLYQAESHKIKVGADAKSGGVLNQNLKVGRLNQKLHFKDT